MCAELHAYPEIKNVHLEGWITFFLFFDNKLWKCLLFYLRVQCIEKVEFVISSCKRAPYIVLNVDLVQLERHQDRICSVLINSADFGFNNSLPEGQVFAFVIDEAERGQYMQVGFIFYPPILQLLIRIASALLIYH